MWRKITLLGISITFCFSVWMALSASKPAQSPIELVKSKYTTDVGLCISSFYAFKDQLKGIQANDPASLAKVRNGFWKFKMDYKRIEFWIEFIYPQTVKDLLNGPPFLKIARNEAGVNVQEPVTMQLFEELLEDDSLFKHKTYLLGLHTSMEQAIVEIQLYKNRKFSDREVFDAIRMGLIRFMSLGFSGFDSPSGKFTVEESRMVWSTMAQYFKFYDTKNWQSVQPAQWRETLVLFEQGATILKKCKNLDDLDKASFTREIINPIYSNIGKIHAASGLENYYEVVKVKTPYNYVSTQIFHTSLIDQSHFVVQYSENQQKDVIDLGRTLFFDPVLSSNSKRSCASCHKPELAFSDGLKKSKAMDENGFVDRNAPGLINAVFANRQFWDLRASHLTQQAEHVIVSEKEFNTDYPTILAKLNESEEYRAMFAKAFKRENSITKDNFSQALAAYVASLQGFNSVFDRYMRKESKQIDPRVLQGFNLFMGKAGCGTCHFAPVFNGMVPPRFEDTESEVLGVPENKEVTKLDEDPGRARGQMKERSPIYYRAFKTPTVRNVSLTAPYMHNGVFNSLEEVMDFYNNGGGKGHGLDVPNQTLPADSLGLTSKEKEAIILFMKSLTDTVGLLKTPRVLPRFPEGNVLNQRVVGGTY